MLIKSVGLLAYTCFAGKLGMRVGMDEMSSTGINKAVDQEVIDRIIKALSELKYGSVQIIVQDSHVVQIDKTEKLRFGVEKPGAKS